jgi:cobalt-precorrin 5A hydrolase
MKTALISLSREGESIIRRLKTGLADADIYLHEDTGSPSGGQTFSSIFALTADIFGRYRGLVYIAPCGVAVRAIAPHIRHKTSDPAVVVVDVGARYAISLLSGHEGGANELAFTVGNILGCEPVITTTSEARKTLIVGIGCRRGTKEEAIAEAIREALRLMKSDISEVRLLASVDKKQDEEGLLKTALHLHIPVRFIPAEEIRASTRGFTHSELVKKRLNLPAVAEPAALLAGRRTTLILPKTIINGVTIALARESFMWSESDREDR